MLDIILLLMGFYLVMTVIGWILGLLRISPGFLGTIFNICLMLFRKIWPIFVVLFMVLLVGGSMGWI